MKVAELLEARILNRDWVHDAKQIMRDDERDVTARIPMEEAKEQVNKFIDEFGHPEWSEEDNESVGLWKDNWEQLIPKNGDYQRWFITIGWYVHSGRGLIKVTRHRRSLGEWHGATKQDVAE